LVTAATPLPAEEPEDPQEAAAEERPNYAPATIQVGEPQHAPSLTPAPDAPPTELGTEAVAWWYAAVSLEREATTSSDIDARAQRMADAAGIYRDRVGDWSRAEALYRSASGAGLRNPDVLRDLGDLVAAREDFSELRTLLEQRATLLEDPQAKAEAFQDAALVARNNLRDDGEAVRLLESAVQADTDDYFSLRLLRDMHLRLQSWDGLPAVLEGMAKLAPPSLAAEYHVERGQVLESRLSRDDDALAAYRDARQVNPSYGPAFLALERFLRRSEAWEDLAELYASEAARDDTADGAFWAIKAAHVWWTRAGDLERASAAFEQLQARGASPAAAVEHSAFLALRGEADQLVAQLRAQAEGADGLTAALGFYRAGHMLEFQLEQPAEALSCYRQALAADPSAMPAVEAIARLLTASGEHEQHAQLLEQLVLDVSDAELLVGLHFMAAEVLEHRLDQPAEAMRHYEAIIERVESYLPALEGLERVYRKLDRHDRLAAVLEQRAIQSDDPDAQATFLYRAGCAWDLGSSEAQRAAEFHRRALEKVPDHAESLLALCRILRADGSWGELAQVLERAARTGRDGDDTVYLFYEAGRLYTAFLDDSQAAITCFRAALELSPGFLPARVHLRSLLLQQGEQGMAHGLLRAEADATEDPARRAWLLFYALQLAPATADADPARIVDDILLAVPAHPAAAELRIQLALQRSDRVAAAEVFRQWGARSESEIESLPAWIQAAHLLAEEGDTVAALQALATVLAADDTAGQPMAALARLAESLGYWEEAARALELSSHAGKASYLGRLQELYLHNAEAALQSYRQAVETDSSDLVAWLGVERLLTSANDHAALAEVHAALVASTEAPAIRGLHALLGAHLYEGLDDLDNARSLYQAAFKARPGRGKAFDGLLRVLIAKGDADAIIALFGEVGISEGLELTNALVDVGDLDRAVAALRVSISNSDDPLPGLLQLERLLAEQEAWREVFETLSSRRRLTSDEEVLGWIERDQRRVLADKLADTDDAWNFYRILHEQHPRDPEILEALANIARTRGETDLALQYLEQRTQVATEPGERASVQRQVAEVHRSAENLDKAREALLEALNHDPEDLEALNELQELATQAEDWRSVVGILARKGVLFEGEEQVETYASIAQIWEDQLGDPGVAAESWRKVLEIDPDHNLALQRLVALGEASGNWKSFVEHGQALAQQLDGAERSALLGRIGLAYESQLHNLTDAMRFLEAASNGPNPDADAARARERLHTERGEWEQAVKALLCLAEATSGEEQLASLLKAAGIRTTTLHNKQAASEIYERVLQVAPDNAEALRFQCEQLFESEAFEQAVSLFVRLEPIEVERDIDDFDEQIEVAQFFFRFGETLRALGRNEDAVARYEHTLELNDTHLPSLEALGPLYLEARDWKKGEKIYRKLLQLTGGRGDPSFLAGIYTQLGYVQRYLGNLDKAKKRFNKALELRQNDVAALLGLAGVQYDRGEWNSLLNVFNNVIFHARERAEVINAYLAKGFVLDRKLELPDKAADHYRKSLNFDPNEPRTLLLLGELSLRKGENKAADEMFERALMVDDIDVGTHANLLVARAIVQLGADERAAAQKGLAEAGKVDITLPDALGPIDPSSSDELLELLSSRLTPPGI